MHNESLTEELNIPMLGGTLIAECFLQTNIDKSVQQEYVEMLKTLLEQRTGELKTSIEEMSETLEELQISIKETSKTLTVSAALEASAEDVLGIIETVPFAINLRSVPRTSNSLEIISSLAFDLWGSNMQTELKKLLLAYRCPEDIQRLLDNERVEIKYQLCLLVIKKLQTGPYLNFQKKIEQKVELVRDLSKRKEHLIEEIAKQKNELTKQKEDIGKESIRIKEKLYQKYSDPSMIENFEFRWTVSFLLAVSDLRYNSATAIISEETLPQLIQNFETAHAIIQQLQTANLSGTYQKSIQANYNYKIEIIGAERMLGLKFSVSNEHRWLSTTLSLKQTAEAIEKLKNAQIRGSELLETLRKIKELSS